MELLAKFWNCDVQESLERVRRAGVVFIPKKERVSEKIRSYCFHAVLNSWRQAVQQARTHLNTAAIPLLESQGVRARKVDDFRKALKQNLFGVLSAEQSEELLERHADLFPCDDRLHWKKKPSLVLPYWESPGVLLGFDLYRKEAPKKTCGFRMRFIGAVDRGFWGLPDSGVPKDAVIGFDALDGLRRRVRHAGVYATEFPWLTADCVEHDVNEIAWRQVPATAVLWAPTLSGAVLSRAAFSDLKISTTPARKNDSPSDLYGRIRKTAAPWSVVAAAWFDALSDEDLKLSVAGWGSGRAPLLGRLKDELTDPQWERLIQAVNGFSKGECRYLDGIEYFEHNYELCRTTKRSKNRGETHTVVTPYLTRLDEILLRNDAYTGRQIIYTGRLINREKEEPFRVSGASSAELVDRINFAAIRSGMTTIRNQREAKFLEICTAFHRPVVRTAFPRFGWDEKENALVFPGLLVRNSGEIEFYDKMSSPILPIPKQYRNIRVDDDPLFWDRTAAAGDSAAIFWILGMFGVASLLRRKSAHEVGGLSWLGLQKDRSVLQQIIDDLGYERHVVYKTVRMEESIHLIQEVSDVPKGMFARYARRSGRFQELGPDDPQYADGSLASHSWIGSAVAYLSGRYALLQSTDCRLVDESLAGGGGQFIVSAVSRLLREGFPTDEFDWPLRSVWGLMRRWILDEELRESFSRKIEKMLFFPDDVDRKMRVLSRMLRRRPFHGCWDLAPLRIYPAKVRDVVFQLSRLSLSVKHLQELLESADAIREVLKSAEPCWRLKTYCFPNRLGRNVQTSQVGRARAATGSKKGRFHTGPA